MTAKILDGNKLAQGIKDSLKEKIKSSGEKPCLATILVGENPASKLYVSMKDKACKEIGVLSQKYELAENTPENEIIDLIQKLNKDEKVNGILVQLPLPKNLNERKILDSINPGKDVDGLTTANLGKLSAGEPAFIPATAKGIIKLIESTDMDVKGRHAVIVGHSNVVGKPTALLLVNKFATITVCHIHSQPIERYTKSADILVSAVGKPGLIKKDMVKEGAIVIDVGISKVKDKVQGDVDFNAVKEVAGYITPVPGGVGPMTIACLLENLVGTL